MNKNRLGLPLLILIAFALRLTLLGEQSLWYDEAVTWLLSRMSLGDLIDWTAADIQPPLYYLLIWNSDILLGESEWALRFPSVLFNTLTVPLIYVLARRLFSGSTTAFIAAALFALSPLMIYYSQEARMYTLLLFEATLASYLLLKNFPPHPQPFDYAQDRPPNPSTSLRTGLPISASPNPSTSLRTGLPITPSPNPSTSLRTGLPISLLYALTATAALYTHYFAAFLLIVHALYVGMMLWRLQPPPSLPRNGGGAKGSVKTSPPAPPKGGDKTKILPSGELGEEVKSKVPPSGGLGGEVKSKVPPSGELGGEVKSKVPPSGGLGERPILNAALMFGLTALLFAPWLPTVLSRWGDDPSYWPGALKLDEALRKILISFTVGETVFEQAGFWLMLGYLAILLGGGLWTISQSGNHFSTYKFSYLFLTLWLILPILLILTLSYQSPKFNPRYSLIAYPPFILLVANLLTHLAPFFQPHAQNYALRTTHYALRSITFIVAFLFILTTALISLTNWFTDPRFAKDDFKALAQFVRERSAADETVLLSSGHLFPVWAYYYGWDNWTPLPRMQRLDISRVTDLSIAEPMAEAVEGKTGVWLVTWQDEVIDPNGVVPFWLDVTGERPNDAGDFWGVGLEHWRLERDAVERLQQSPIEWPLAFNFANQIDLVGMTQLSDTDIALFWRPRQPLPDDVVVSLDLTDREGFDWDSETVAGRPGREVYPPSRWPVGGVVMTRHRLPWQIGTPPGLYVAEIGVGQTTASESDFSGWDILDAQGRPQRRTALLDPINLSHLVQPDDGPLPIAADPLVDFLPIVAVRRSILPQTAAEPGDQILLALLWQAGQFNLDNIAVAFDLIDAQEQTFRVGGSLTPSRRYNLPRWQPGDLVLGQYWLDIPPQAAPGPAKLQLHLINDSGFVYDEIFPLDDLEILPTERNFTPPSQVDILVEATFAEQATLLGVDCQPACRAAPGETITLTLHWQAQAPLAANYTIFTHLLGPDETVLVNADHAPPKPTQGWVPDEIIADPVNLTLPADLPPGDYAVEVGLYDAADPTFPRLPLDSGETRIILPQPLRIE